MPTKKLRTDSLQERINSSYTQLASAAEELNTISNELGTSIAKVESVLRRLNVGVPAWVISKSWHSPDGNFYDFEEIGYDKLRKDWSLAIRTRSGDYSDPEGGTVESWPFNEAPRRLRIAAAEKFPELFDELTKQAQKTTEQIQAQLAVANQFADLVLDASKPKKSTRKR